VHDTKTTNRREALTLLGLGAVATKVAGAEKTSQSSFEATVRLPRKTRRVVVIGGGFAGATAARSIKLQSPQTQVVLIERKSHYTACPFSNLVIAGERKITAQQFSWQALSRTGVEVITANVTDVDTDRREVKLQDNSRIDYDRLVLAPGIALRFDAIEGYNEQAATILPHAWQAGSQTTLLRQQLKSMPNNGLVVIAVPQNPYRCPPGPYERASLIAHYLRREKRRAKLLVLDAKDRFSKMSLFRNAWQELYGDLIEWRGLSDSGAVRKVEPATRTLHTDFDNVTADVANVIPPQTAGAIAHIAGVTDASGWCPVNASTFESTQANMVHVIGDAALASAMPKSAFAANAQAKVCATQIARSLQELPPLDSTLINTCYSLVAPNYGISVAGVYQPVAERLEEVEGAGGTSPVVAKRTTRRLEANYAQAWFKTITRETFG